MKLWKPAALACLGMLVCAAFAPKASADEWNKKTLFTFHDPVEVSGVIFQPGEYVFQLLDSQSDRHIVQIFDKDETYLYATIMAIPDYRVSATDKTVVTFREASSNSPQPLDEWFYPGDSLGLEFPSAD